MNTTHTTRRIQALFASGAVLATREDNTVENLTAAFERNNAALMERLNSQQATIDTLTRDVNQIGNRVIPAAGRNVGIVSRRSGGLAGGSRPTDEEREENISLERRAVATFLRTGDESEIGSLTTRASGSGMVVQSDVDGGYLVVPHMSNVIRQRLFDLSPLARLARHETITTGDAFEEPIDVGDIDALWVGESDPRPPLKTSDLAKMRVPVNEIYTNQPVTQRLLDDSQFNIGAWLEEKIGNKFARKEGAAFVNGNGKDQPMGLLHGESSVERDGKRGYFQLQHVWSRFDPSLPNAFEGAAMIDALVDVVYQLRAPYRANARWLMNRNTAARIRKIKDADGRFIFSDTTEGVTPTLLGFPVEFDEEMPDIADGERAIAFGDFKQGYIVVDKAGIRMLLDPYTMKPHVLFYAYRRVGGQIQNGEAIKLIKFGLPQ